MPRYPMPPGGAAPPPPPMPPGMAGAPGGGGHRPSYPIPPPGAGRGPVDSNRYLAPPGMGGGAPPSGAPATPPAGRPGYPQPHTPPHMGPGGVGGPEGGYYEGPGAGGGGGEYRDDPYYNGDGPHGGGRGRGDRYGGGGGGRWDRRGGPRDDDFRGGRGSGGGGGGRRRGGRDERRPPRGGPPPEDMELREATNTVWVGNMDPVEHSEPALRRAFGEFGKVMRVAKQAEKSYCFVHFRRVEEAQNAVQTLSQRGSLGQARFNYGKMFEYTPEEMNAPYDPNAPEETEDRSHGMRRRREEGEGDDRALPPPRRSRAEKEPHEPTNVLWVGSLPPFISDEKLREVFEVFGTVILVSRMDKGNMAFVHFDSVEHATMALETMRGRPIENGVVLALNFGHAQRSKPDPAAPAATEGIPPNETPTNVIYLGQLPSNIDDNDINELFAPYEGFINAKYVASTGIAFGHFDSIEHSTAARLGLNNATMKGVPIRVNFGKNNHTLMVGGGGAAGGEEGEFNLDAMMRGPGLDGTSGAMVAGSIGVGLPGGGALTLPAMGDGSKGGMAGSPPPGGMSGVYTRERVAPELTLDSRLQSILGTTYNNCGAKDFELSPTQIQAICTMVDDCVDDATEKRLDETLLLYCPLKSVHVFNVVAKRLREFFNDDPHKKLYVLYATTRVLLGAQTDFVQYTGAALNAYLMTLLVASEGQTSSGMDRLSAIIENLQQHPFMRTKCNVNDDYAAEFQVLLEAILNRAKAEQDLTSLLSKRRRR